MIKYSYYNVPENFIGACKIIEDGSIRYYKNNKYHREDGPAVWREDGSKDWYFKDKCYGHNNDFTIETWILFVENLKREERLKIFL